MKTKISTRTEHSYESPMFIGTIACDNQPNHDSRQVKTVDDLVVGGKYQECRRTGSHLVGHLGAFPDYEFRREFVIEAINEKTIDVVFTDSGSKQEIYLRACLKIN